MKRIIFAVAALAALSFVLAVNAAAPASFAGTWELDKTKSQNLPRFWQDVQSVTLTITQTDKQVTVQTKIVGGGASGGPGGGGGGGRGFGAGMGGPLSYNLDGSETTTEGERGKSTTKAVWSKDSSVLELSVKRSFTTPNGDVTATTTDKYTLSADGKVLTDNRHSESPRGPQDSTLVYNKKD
jgi:hypothetical protein